MTFTSLTEFNFALLCRITISTVIRKQSARLGDEVRNWIINLKAVTKNKKIQKTISKNYSLTKTCGFGISENSCHLFNL